jgi:hypothetical protein
MRDPKSSNREAELPAITRIGSGDLFGCIVKLLPNKSASKRTKERIKVHSPFRVVDDGWCHALNDWCLMLRSQKTGWCGWLPKSEIEVVMQPNIRS